MAAKRSSQPAEAPAALAERLAVASAPWLAGARERLVAAWEAGRFQHALLVTGRAGLGQSEIALWDAQLVLCESASCGQVKF